MTVRLLETVERPSIDGGVGGCGGLMTLALDNDNSGGTDLGAVSSRDG